MIGRFYGKTSGGAEFCFYAHAYQAGEDSNGVFSPERLIVGFGSAVDVSVGFISPEDARKMAALLIRRADDAEGKNGRG